MTENQIEEKEFVYLPKSLAKKIKGLENGRVFELLVLEYFEKSKSEIKSGLESLDDDVVRYQASMIKAKQTFEDAKNKQIKDSYETWEKLDKELPNIKKKGEDLVDALDPVTKKLEEIKVLYNQINQWEIKDLLETLKAISDILSYDNEKSNMIKFLFENYKK